MAKSNDTTMRQRRHHQAEKGPAQFLEKRRAKTTYEGYGITYKPGS
jgi:hypothetical protein